MKKILTIGALVSLIPLASVSIVSCKKKKAETNNEEQKPTTPPTGGQPSAPSTPDIDKPSVDESEKPGSGSGGSGSGGSGSGGSGSGGSGSGGSGSGSGSGDSGDSGGSGDNSDTRPKEGVMIVEGAELGFTADHTGKWWFHIWIHGYNLSNNIDHYNFSVRDKTTNDKVEIPNNFWRVQYINESRSSGYFTQRLANNPENQVQELYDWLTRQYNKRNYNAIQVEPSKEGLIPSIPEKTPNNNDSNPTITNFRLQYSWIGATKVREIVVTGSNLPIKFSGYDLKWKDNSSNTSESIPKGVFSEYSVYNSTSYVVFRLKSTDMKIIEAFDQLFEKDNKGEKVFDLTLK